MEINQYFHDLKRRFSRETNPLPALDARLLIQYVLGFSDADFITGGQGPLTAQQIEKIEELADRRMRGEPLSRIVGGREFWGLHFKVTPDTLDPRADTEILVERALVWITGRYGRDAAITIADIGTGTGCILISLLTELPNARGLAIDLSPAALDIARHNARMHGVEERIAFVNASYVSALADGAVDCLVSNPPYIPNLDIPNLSKDVRNFDPILALSGGDDGLDAYRTLFTETKRALKFDGRALFEIGFGQLPDILRLVDNTGATLEAVTPDLGGIPRVVEISYGDNEKKI